MWPKPTLGTPAHEEGMPPATVGLLFLGGGESKRQGGPGASEQISGGEGFPQVQGSTLVKKEQGLQV